MMFSHHNASGWQYLVVALLLIIGIVVLLTFKPLKEGVLGVETPSEIRNSERSLEAPNIEAEAAVVWDASVQQVLFSKNPDKPLPLASITKLITAVTAIETLPPRTPVVITEADLATEGESGLILGDTWKLEELIGYMLSISSNDAAEALARTTETYVRTKGKSTTFTTLMNQKALQIGLKGSKFKNPTGLDVIEGQEAGGIATASDVIRIMQYIHTNHPDIGLESTTDNATFSSESKTYTANNTNEIVNQLPHISISKTGFTYLAGGNLAVMVDLGIDRPLYIVVLGSSIDGRFRDVDKLFAAAVEVIQNGTNYVSSSN